MSDAVGSLSFGGANWPDGPVRYSEQESRTIGAEVKRIVDDAYQLAHRVLSRSRETLDRVVIALLERETFSSEELETLAKLTARPGPTQ